MRERHCSEWSTACLRPALALAHPGQLSVYPNCPKSVRRNGARRTFRTSGTNGGKGTGACGCNTGALTPILPMAHSVLIRCRVLRPAGCQSIVRPAAIVCLFGPSPLHCQQVPCSIHPLAPSTVLVQIVNPEDPDGGWMAAKGIHHISSPNCGKGETARLRTFRSHAVLPSRPTANRGCMLAAFGTSHVNRSWSAGTSTPGS